MGHQYPVLTLSRLHRLQAEIVKHLRWIDHRELRFVRHLGSGGYGSVDECEWKGQLVAVKNLLRCSEKKRVEEEAAVLVRVEHPNVVKLVGCAFNGEESRGMIVMELMDQDLHHLISETVRLSQSRNEPPFPLPVALEIMSKVATAMKHIRSCNVLHRDLKTTNILVKSRTRSESRLMSMLKFGAGSSSAGGDFDVKLADFGLSKYKLGDSMFTTKASEAQLWRAPETSERRNYSWPADVFSFGVVCYEILSGEVPFRGMVQGPDLLKLVREGKRPEIPTYCPRTVAELVNACWATDPKERPDFEEICTKLESCLTTCNEGARPSSSHVAEGQ